jgi:hypothetical protein
MLSWKEGVGEKLEMRRRAEEWDPQLRMRILNNGDPIKYNDNIMA